MNSKTRQELAADYGITRKTLYRLFKKEGIIIPSQGLLTPKILAEIYAKLGYPNQKAA